MRKILIGYFCECELFMEIPEHFSTEQIKDYFDVFNTVENIEHLEILKLEDIQNENT